MATMSNRDGLEADLRVYLPSYLEGAESDLPAVILAEALADYLHDEGYRKPRVITTVEELDALPVGSIVIDAYAATCTRLGSGTSPFNWKRVTTAVRRYAHSHQPYLPAEVIYAPEEPR